MQTEPAIIAHKITKQFGANTVLNQCSLTLKPGEAIGLIGRNGAGKTTLLRVLTTSLEFDEGSLTIDGAAPSQGNSILTKLGFLADKSPVFPTLNSIENIRFWAQIHQLNKSKQKSQIDWLIDALSLAIVANKEARFLSKGFRQRLALACSVVSQPRYLLLDEPCSGLDPEQLIVVRRFLRSLENTGILLSSHHLSEIDKVCDQVIFIDKGKINEKQKIADLTSTQRTIPYQVTLESGHDKFVNFLSANKLAILNRDHTRIVFSVPKQTSGHHLKQVLSFVVGNDIALQEIHHWQNPLENFFDHKESQ